MKKRHLLLLFISALVTTVIFTSCDNDLEFTNSPGHVLSFSTDTISFDTVFTTIGSSTRRLMVYNSNDKAVNISSVKLASGEESGFYINVEGMKGTQFQDVEIWKKDSLNIDIGVNVDPTQKDSPVLIKDSIIFLTNTVQQVVHLIAYGQDVFIWRGKTIEQDTILTNKKPFLIYDSLLVAQDKTLTIERGTILYFHSKAELLVKGNIVANGTWEEPIILRGDRRDEIYAGLPYDNTPGQWGGIRLFEESYNNELTHVYIRNGSYGILADSSSISTPKLILKYSVLHNVSGDLISGVNCHIEAENCQLSNAKGALVRMLGGKGKFSQCTMANYFGFSSRTAASVVLKNYQVMAGDNMTFYPIEEAIFQNCIIYGNGTRMANGSDKRGEIDLQNKYNKETIPAAFNFLFNHCLIGAEEYEGSNFIEIVWNQNSDSYNFPDFVYLNKENDYVYDFRLEENSPARNIADRSIAAQYPYDITGKYRFQDEGPDLGCYEY